MTETAIKDLEETALALRELFEKAVADCVRMFGGPEIAGHLGISREEAMEIAARHAAKGEAHEG